MITKPVHVVPHRRASALLCYIDLQRSIGSLVPPRNLVEHLTEKGTTRGCQTFTRVCWAGLRLPLPRAEQAQLRKELRRTPSCRWKVLPKSAAEFFTHSLHAEDNHRHQHPTHSIPRGA